MKIVRTLVGSQKCSRQENHSQVIPVAGYLCALIPLFTNLNHRKKTCYRKQIEKTMKVKCLTSTSRWAGAMLIALTGGISVLAADYPTTVQSLSPVAYY